MLAFRTAGHNGYGVQYLPFFDNKLAVATAANYGLVGNGRLYILLIEPNGTIANPISWDTQDGLFDISWSENHENQLVAASGDGSIKLFDTTVGQFPVMNWREHEREVFLVNWNLVDKSTFVSSSWDGTIKIWDPLRPQSLMTLRSPTDHSVRSSGPNPGPNSATNSGAPGAPGTTPSSSTAQCVYNASFSPHSPSTIISCNGTSHIQVWDIRAPRQLQVDYIGHGGMEALSCDWNKYKSTVVATAGTDKLVRIWDLRMITKIDQPNPIAPMPAYHIRGPTPLNELLGHEFAVRKVMWSPHSGNELISASYDMTCRVWNDMSNERARFLNSGAGGCKGVMSRHREFVIGCDYSLWGEPGWAASTGWDEMVYVWDSKRL